MRSAILEDLHDMAAALARAVDRANVRIKTRCDDPATERLVRRCLVLQRTFERLARTVPASHPDHEAIARAREIYRLAVQRLLASARVARNPSHGGDGFVTLPVLDRALHERPRWESSEIGRHARDRRAGALEHDSRQGDRPRAPLTGGGHVAGALEGLAVHAGAAAARPKWRSGSAGRDSSRAAWSARRTPARRQAGHAEVRDARRAPADGMIARPVALDDVVAMAGPVAHDEFIAMAADAVRQSRLRLESLRGAADHTRETARRTAALVDETARILNVVSGSLYRAA